jgi:hypothetical protein
MNLAQPGSCCAGALVGVSLCDAEASIAAPMTSRVPHVGIMCTAVAEGRCSMVTSLIIFKYTMVYAYIQVSAPHIFCFCLCKVKLGDVE